MHYYQFNIADYRKDTTHLIPIEHYIYRTLIDWYYLDEQPIPKITQVVSRRLGLGCDMEPNINNVLKDFFIEHENGWHHKRISEEIEAYHHQSLVNKENGKLGGRPKKTGSVNFANRNESETEPKLTLTKNQEPITNNHIKEKPLYALISLGVEESVAKDWMAVRKAKRAPITETVLADLKREAEKAGITVADAVLVCAKKSWQGFNSAWKWQDALPEKIEEQKKFDMHEWLMSKI